MSTDINTGAAAAQAVREEIPTWYDATFKVASRFLGLPSRVQARIRRFNDLFNQDTGVRAQAQSDRHSGDDVPHSIGLEFVPGPVGFITSGYFFGLFIMALVLNRIQNIVVPNRHSLMMRQHPFRNRRGRFATLRMIWSFMFPVDLSSTFSRTSFRVPSIYLLSKSLLIWTVLLLQSAQLFPSWKWDWLQALNQWVTQKTMEDICWFTFTSTCTALAVGALTNGLEGLQLHNNAPFNLFSFAFQLHIYASPSTHADRVQGFPSRPSKHVLITILIPLFQLTMIHCLEVKKEWARIRLIPTGICSLLNLIHFHSIIWTQPSSYPLTNFFPCVVESMLSLIVGLTVGLNFLTQILVDGTITRPLFGHAESLMPNMSEDFNVALVRLGTASLEATSVAGLGNEVGDIASTSTTQISRRSPSVDGTVELDRNGVASITPSYNKRGRKRIRKHGFANNIEHVKVQTQRSDMWADAIVNIGWIKAFASFIVAAVQVVRRLFHRVWVIIRYGAWRGLPQQSVTSTAATLRSESPESELEFESYSDREERYAYRRFLRGDSVTSSDEDFEPRNAVRPESPSSSSEDAEDEEARETVELYTDLSQEASTSSAAPVLLAHMTSGSPLTRRGYRRLLTEVRAEPANTTANEDEDDGDVWEQHTKERRVMKSPPVRDDVVSESGQNCVICTVEPRNIICWPCRCLALCNDCRENLASRSSASKHTCPCCRRNVEGYSKIFIP